MRLIFVTLMMILAAIGCQSSENLPPSVAESPAVESPETASAPAIAEKPSESTVVFFVEGMT